MQAVETAGLSRWWRDPQEVEGHVLGVFEGGGAKGILYVSALKALLRRKLWFSAVAGSSAGAITAAMIAAGMRPGEIAAHSEEGLDALSLPTTWSGVRRLSRAVGLLDRAKLLEWLRGILQAQCGLEKAEDGPSFEDLFRHTGIDLFVVAVDLTMSRLAVFNRQLSPKCDVAEAVVASATIPIAFEPSLLISLDEQDQLVLGSGRYFADGGIASNFPVFVFRDNAFRVHASLGPSADEPLVGFLLDESHKEEQDPHPYCNGKFAGTYHDLLALSDRGGHGVSRRYRSPHFRKRKQRSQTPRSRGLFRAVYWMEMAFLTLLTWLGRGFHGGDWPGEWSTTSEKRKETQQKTAERTAGAAQEPDRRLRLLWSSLRMWISTAPGVLILGVLAYSAMFWLGLLTVVRPILRELVRDFSHDYLTNFMSVLWYAVSWLLTVAIMVFAAMVWLIGLAVFALVRVAYHTAGLYGADFVRTFLQTPAAPPWVGRGPNETLVRLHVPDWITTRGVRHPERLPAVMASCEEAAFTQLNGVEGYPLSHEPASNGNPCSGSADH